MNKLFKKIAGLSLGLVMAIGVGVAVGSKEAKVARAVDLSATFNSTKTTNISATEGNITSDIENLSSSIFTVMYYKNGASNDFYIKQNDFRMYATKQTYKGNYFTVSCTSSYTIKSIAFGGTTALTTVNVFKGAVTVSSNQVTGTSVTASSGSYAINDTQFTIYNNNKNVASNTQVRFGSITITYESSGGTSYNYSITYNGNGNTGGTVPSAQSGSGTSVTISNTVLTKAGFTHDGWAESTSGAVVYTLGQVVTLSGNLTKALYAHWTAQTYSVTYNGNGNTSGNVPTDATAYAYNASVTVSGANTLAKTDCTFNGWNTKADGTGTPYAANATFNITENVTLYAQWNEVVQSYAWQKVTSTSEFVNGTHILITQGSYYLSVSTTADTTPRLASLTLSKNLPTLTANKTECFTVSGSGDSIKLVKATDNAKWLITGSSNNAARINTGTTGQYWTISSAGTNEFYLQSNSGSRYLSRYGTTDFRSYTSSSQSGAYANLTLYKLVAGSTDPEITDVSLSGSPAASATIGGGNSWTMSATVTAINDPSTTLSRNVNWTVSPSGAVTFSKTTSASEEEIIVTAVNTANSNVVITASSAATGFTTVHGDSNSFNIIKSYVVSNVTLSATTAGGPTYDAAGASSFVVGFTTAVIYSGDAGTSKVNITVSPSAGVSGYGDNVTAGAFNLTFTKSGTYSVTSTSVENNTKYQTVSVTINNIVVPGYEKATSASALRNNAKLVIGSSAKGVLMKNAAASAAIGNTSYTVSDDFIPEEELPNDAVEFTLHTSNEYWELTTVISSTTYYLEYDETKQSSGNSASYASASSNLTKWSITFANTGDVNLVPSTADSRSLRCNTSNSNFACYAGTQATVQMYIKIDTSPYFSINETTLYLGPRGTSTLTLTAHNGASDTITWASSDTDIATVSPSSGLSTIVTGVAEGDITITATFTKAEFDTISVAVHVIPLDTYVNIGVTTFTKVTSTPAGGWAGTYLLVDETASEIFDGSASPLVADATKSVTISSSSITATNSMIASSFNIKASTNGYTLKSNSNHYVGNRSTTNGISTSVGVEYEVSIGSDGTVTALLEDGTSSETTLRHNASAQNNIWRFYTGSTGNDVALYKADGEMRAISNTLTDFYDAVKANEYLVCHASGTGSKIDFDGIVDCTGDLTSQDYDTLKRMSAKSAEDNGNYLEDLISDYDYLVQFKGQTDIFGRFDEGGAMYGHSIVRNNLKLISKNASTTIVIIVISTVSLAAVGGYFFFRKKKEDK